MITGTVSTVGLSNSALHVAVQQRYFGVIVLRAAISAFPQDGHELQSLVPVPVAMSSITDRPSKVSPSHNTIVSPTWT